VYLDDGDARPSFFVASRGHHADIGGTTPGSMPPFSTSIAEEGVLIDNFKLIAQGVLREDALRGLLAAGAYPSRNPAQNLADLRAQIAANEKGAQELGRMVAEFGADTVGATFALAFHAAQRSDHGDLLAALAIDGPLRAGRHRLVAQILGITLLGVLGQPTSQPAQITFRRHGLS